MDFESLDWEAEAARVAWAFGVTESCEFVAFSPFNRTLVRLPRGGDSISPRSPQNSKITVVYSPKMRIYCCMDHDRGNTEPDGQAEVIFHADGGIAEPYAASGETGSNLNVELATSLFKLGLLTPEIEEALGVAITAHEKLEWVLEYEQRMKVL